MGHEPRTVQSADSTQLKGQSVLPITEIPILFPPPSSNRVRHHQKFLSLVPAFIGCTAAILTTNLSNINPCPVDPANLRSCHLPVSQHNYWSAPDSNHRVASDQAPSKLRRASPSNLTIRLTYRAPRQLRTPSVTPTNGKSPDHFVLFHPSLQETHQSVHHSASSSLERFNGKAKLTYPSPWCPTPRNVSRLTPIEQPSSRNLYCELQLRDRRWMTHLTGLSNRFISKMLILYRR